MNIRAPFGSIVLLSLTLASLAGSSAAVEAATPPAVILRIDVVHKKPDTGKSWDFDGSDPEIYAVMDGIRAPQTCDNSLTCDIMLAGRDDDHYEVAVMDEDEFHYDDTIGYVTCSIKDGCDDFIKIDKHGQAYRAGKVTISAVSAEGCIPSDRQTDDMKYAAATLNLVLLKQNRNTKRADWTAGEMTPEMVKYAKSVDNLAVWAPVISKLMGLVDDAIDAKGVPYLDDIKESAGLLREVYRAGDAKEVAKILGAAGIKKGAEELNDKIKETIKGEFYKSLGLPEDIDQIQPYVDKYMDIVLPQMIFQTVFTWRNNRQNTCP